MLIDSSFQGPQETPTKNGSKKLSFKLISHSYDIDRNEEAC